MSSTMTPSPSNPQAPADAPGAEPSLRERYAQVKARIAAAAKRAGREPSSIILVAVTKNAEPDQIRELIQLGQVDLGENRVQQLTQRAAIIGEWLGRARTIPGVSHARPGPADTILAASRPARADSPSSPGVRWHMIGHLQRNKARKVVELCRLVHSVDSLRLAEELQMIAQRREHPVEILLQVNCSGEESKFGCAIGAAVHLAEQIETMIQVKVRGLMTMAPLEGGLDAARRTFRRCRELFEDIASSGAVSRDFNILSMGMSGDFDVAIEEGANLVRVGSSLFGAPRAGETDDAGTEEPD
ncbi:MAG: YggS family pyridoxal phosphate-dependent enzyme [Phycisphaerales bacterium]